MGADQDRCKALDRPVPAPQPQHAFFITKQQFCRPITADRGAATCKTQMHCCISVPSRSLRVSSIIRSHQKQLTANLAASLGHLAGARQQVGHAQFSLPATAARQMRRCKPSPASAHSAPIRLPAPSTTVCCSWQAALAPSSWAAGACQRNLTSDIAGSLPGAHPPHRLSCKPQFFMQPCITG